ncbi:hypothetical protein BHM03_00002217 [Ensete ventricosum]|nr:hypothetical protein BHM03_00002217 [Ensete ventricosum]
MGDAVGYRRANFYLLGTRTPRGLFSSDDTQLTKNTYLCGLPVRILSAVIGRSSRSRVLEPQIRRGRRPGNPSASLAETLSATGRDPRRRLYLIRSKRKHNRDEMNIPTLTNHIRAHSYRFKEEIIGCRNQDKASNARHLLHVLLSLRAHRARQNQSWCRAGCRRLRRRRRSHFQVPRGRNMEKETTWAMQESEESLSTQRKKKKPSAVLPCFSLSVQSIFYCDRFESLDEQDTRFLEEPDPVEPLNIPFKRFLTSSGENRTTAVDPAPEPLSIGRHLS